MSFKISYFLLFLLFFFACSIDKSPVSPIQEMKPGKFVIDYFDTEIKVKINPESDSLWSYFSYSINYHFENQPGTVGSFGIIIDYYYGMSLFLDYASPIPVNKMEKFEGSYWIKEDFLGKDSINVDFGMSGTFWNFDKREKRFLGFINTFNWSKNIMVPILREAPFQLPVKNIPYAKKVKPNIAG